MDIPYEILPILGPFGIVLILLAGLWRALANGSLQPRASVDQLAESWEARLDATRQVTDMWREAYEAERDARIRQDAATRELLEVSRIVSDGIEALRVVATRERGDG